MKRLLTILVLFISCSVSAQTTVIDSLISGGIYRNFRIYVPAVYNNTKPHPVVFDLHGYTSTATAEQLYSNFMPIADTANILMVYPQGTTYLGQPFWNMGQVPGGVNDVQFISDLIDYMNSNYNISLDSVFSCGMSNGGYMSHYLACQLGNRITAIASVTGSMIPSQRLTCHPNRAVPVMQISGTADGTVAYNGSTGSLPIDTVVKFWVQNNNCNPTPALTALPDVNATDGCTAEHYVYSGGDNGSSVELYKIIGGDHTWTGSPYIIGTTNQDFSASAEIWRFFRKYRLGQFTVIDEHESHAFKIFPNPAHEILNIESTNALNISICDISGRNMVNTQEKKIDISIFPSGIYFIAIESPNGRAVQKLIKQ